MQPEHAEEEKQMWLPYVLIITTCDTVFHPFMKGQKQKIVKLKIKVARTWQWENKRVF